METHIVARQIHKNEFKMVCKAIRNALFLPKQSWHKPLHEMAYDGLVSQKWTGIGLFTKKKELVAYLDYKHRDDTWIDVGICLTIVKYRNHGYMQVLFLFLLDMYQRYTIRIGTYENNTAMIHCIKRQGFQEERRVLYDRIDGTSTIYFLKKNTAAVKTEV